jgi:glycosyltransferase EpsE
MFTKAPLVSVVMPIRRGNPEFLEKSINSILAQTLANLELLIILDADENSEMEAVARVLLKFKNDRRLRIVGNKGKGLVGALNTGILSSRGKYIARMDGDDISFPNRLKLQVATIENNNVDLVGGWAYVINEQGKTIGKLTPSADAKRIRKTIMLHNPFLHSAVTFKKSILNYSGLYNSALFGAEDYDLWLRLVALGFKCVNVPSFVIALRETSDSVVRGGGWKITRVNYARAKALGLTKRGFNDPLSIGFCLISPFSILVSPSIVLNFKLLRFFRKQSFKALREKEGSEPVSSFNNVKS